MSTSAALATLADLAEAQDGLLTTRLAEDRGVPRRELSRMAQLGALERTARGVYRIAGAPRPRLEELRAAWLQLAPELTIDQRTADHGVVSHESAALIYDVGQLDPSRMEFTVRHPRRLRSRRSDVMIYRAALADEDAEWRDGILVTTPCRIVHDLCAVRTDGAHLARVVADVLANDLATNQELSEVLEPFATAYGATAARGEFLSYLLDLGGQFEKVRTA